MIISEINIRNVRIELVRNVLDLKKYINIYIFIIIVAFLKIIINYVK